MEEKKQLLLNLINSDNYTSMDIKEIMYILCIPSEEKRNVESLLNELKDEGFIIITKKNKYISIKSQGYISGIFRASSKGFGFIDVSNEEDDIYVSRDNINGALNGDVVIAKITIPKTLEKKAEAIIIDVAKRKSNEIIGRYEASKNFGFVIPDDIRIDKDVFIPKKNCGNAKNGDKVVVRIDKWSEDGRKSEGTIIEVLGRANDPKTDFISVVNMFGLDKEFSEEVLKEAREIKQIITDDDMVGRRDLRNENIITIDGADTKDIDDAICVKKINNGLYELGVHIADVSHYVKEGSSLDNEAINRGTSVYLINKVLPMLPKELSNGICSLNEGEDRCALSIVMKIDNNGKVIDSEIFKSLICSKKKCVYSEVTDIILKKKDAKYDEYSNFLDMITHMYELKNILEDRRKKRGSIEFDTYESNIELDENDKAINVCKRERGISDEIIEEFMLCANETIAETFFFLQMPFIYRIHEQPDNEKIYSLNKILNNFNIKIKGLNNDIYPKTLQEVLDKVKNRENGKMISNMLLRSMQLARYSEENEGHFGLAAKYYCHFTSPIRRYPDLFIHRVISEYIASGYNISQDNLNKYESYAKEYAKSSSDLERNAEKAEREFDDIKKCEFMENKIGQEYDGVISSLTSFGMFVELENTIEGLVRYEDMQDDYYDFNEDIMCIIGRRTNKKYIIGDKIRVKVKDASKQLRRIDFEIVEEKNNESSI